MISSLFFNRFCKSAIKSSFRMNSAQKMIYFLFIDDQIKKRKTNCSLFNDEIICNDVSKMSNASSFFYYFQKNFDDVVVFIVDKHVSARLIIIVFVTNDQREKFSFQNIDIMNEIHKKQMFSSHKNLYVL